MNGKPQWIAKKYNGDDSHSWAIIDKRYIPKGHKGPIDFYLPQCAVSYAGLNRSEATRLLKIKKEQAKNQ